MAEPAAKRRKGDGDAPRMSVRYVFGARVEAVTTVRCADHAGSPLQYKVRGAQRIQALSPLAVFTLDSSNSTFDLGQSTYTITAPVLCTLVTKPPPAEHMRDFVTSFCGSPEIARDIMDAATVKRVFSYGRLMNTAVSEFPARAIGALQDFRRWMYSEHAHLETPCFRDLFLISDRTRALACLAHACARHPSVAAAEAMRVEFGEQLASDPCGMVVRHMDVFVPHSRAALSYDHIAALGVDSDAVQELRELVSAFTSDERVRYSIPVSDGVARFKSILPVFTNTITGEECLARPVDLRAREWVLGCGAQRVYNQQYALDFGAARLARNASAKGKAYLLETLTPSPAEVLCMATARSGGSDGKRALRFSYSALPVAVGEGERVYAVQTWTLDEADLSDLKSELRNMACAPLAVGKARYGPSAKQVFGGIGETWMDPKLQLRGATLFFSGRRCDETPHSMAGDGFDNLFRTLRGLNSDVAARDAVMMNAHMATAAEFVQLGKVSGCARTVHVVGDLTQQANPSVFPYPRGCTYLGLVSRWREADMESERTCIPMNARPVQNAPPRSICWDGVEYSNALRLERPQEGSVVLFKDLPVFVSEVQDDHVCFVGRSGTTRRLQMSLFCSMAEMVPVNGNVSIRDVWNFADGSLGGWTLAADARLPASALERARALGCVVPDGAEADGEDLVAISIFTMFSKAAKL